jgi:superfamily II DNA or RNA helicase
MLATITSNQDLILSEISVWEVELVDQHFSADPPRRRYITDTAQQGWDGVFRKYNRRKQRLARPFLAELRSLCNTKGLVLDVRDARPAPTYELADESAITPDMLSGITLEPFQLDGIKRVLSAEVGIFDVTTGGGKTEIMAGICKVIPCKTVIITEAVVIVDQIKRRLMLRDVCEEPGVFYAGSRPDGETIIIGTIASMTDPKHPDYPERDKCSSDAEYQRKVKRYPTSLKAYKTRLANKKYLDAAVADADMILVDECDKAVSTTWKALFRYRFKGRYRYGFSGTPYDKRRPVEKLVLQEHLGSVIFLQEQKQVEAAGLIIPLVYNMLVLGDWENRTEASAYDIAFNENIVHNERFHRAVAAICARYKEDGILILVDRDLLGNALVEAIQAMGIRAEFCHGKTPRPLRTEMLREFEERTLKVLVGGKNLGRGLDLKGGCEVLILCTGGQLESEFEQRLGRARRLNRNNVGRVFDFFFAGNKYLAAHSRERLKAVVKMGYKSTVIFKDCTVDGAKFVRSRFRKPSKH